MPSKEHYDLENRLISRVGALDAPTLRSALIRYIEQSPVSSVHVLANVFGVPIRLIETEVKTAPSLKPCPFCGSTAVDPEGWMAGDRTTGPACDDCGGSAESVERWNTRPQLSE